jgi:hypothetical protein
VTPTPLKVTVLPAEQYKAPPVPVASPAYGAATKDHSAAYGDTAVEAAVNQKTTATPTPCVTPTPLKVTVLAAEQYKASPIPEATPAYGTAIKDHGAAYGETSSNDDVYQMSAAPNRVPGEYWVPILASIIAIF